MNCPRHSRGKANVFWKKYAIDCYSIKDDVTESEIQTVFVFIEPDQLRAKQRSLREIKGVLASSWARSRAA